MTIAPSSLKGPKMRPNMLFIDKTEQPLEYRSASMARYSMLRRAMRGKRSVLVCLTPRGYLLEDSQRLGQIDELYSFVDVLNYIEKRGVL